MTIDLIRQCLLSHRPATVQEPGYARAAVALVLREGAAGAEFLAIRRSQRSGDPWSGHMALPGGREHPADRDLFSTAARETWEEVGINLHRFGERLGHLDDLRAIGHGRPLDLIITPFVCSLTRPVTLVLDPREVHSALWVPLAFLLRREACGSLRYPLDGQAVEHDAFIYQGHSIWGLTYRILSGLLEMLRPQVGVR